MPSNTRESDSDKMENVDAALFECGMHPKAVLLPNLYRALTSGICLGKEWFCGPECFEEFLRGTIAAGDLLTGRSRNHPSTENAPRAVASVAREF